MKKTKERLVSRSESKTIVDLMFDNNIFRNDLTRDDLNAVEEYLDYSLNSRLKSIDTIRNIMKTINERYPG